MIEKKDSSANSLKGPFLKNIMIFGLFSLCLLGCREKENSEENVAQNRLAQANSPYLIQHADNPVDWYEWGPEALDKAAQEDKPLIISVGYAACHWCHVMEEESFMDPAVAEIMNRDYISIKIDREERPDIDKIYMNAAQLLNGSGGWPLNVVTLPDGKPFFAGTYFTPEEWKSILEKIAIAYKTDKEHLTKIAEELTEGIRSVNSLDSLIARKVDYSQEDYRDLYKNWQTNIDTRNGGYKGAQKFPLPVSWDGLLQYYYLTEDEGALESVTFTLDKMARGGIYDQIGGGFARYTVDKAWLIPHFEKMLYDNAQLISLYSKAYKTTSNTEYAEVVKQSIEFVERELGNSEGGFYSSVNADSEGEEGKYYVWTSEEIKNSLSSTEAELISDYYNIKVDGNWEEGKNILHRKFSEEEYLERRELEKNEFRKDLESAKGKLLEAREKRISPSIDDKSLTSWNALMVTAYLDAFTAIGNPEYLKKAIACAEFLSDKMIKKDNSLWRSYRGEKAGVNAFLDDYVFLTSAYLNLYQVSFEKKWLEKAEEVTNYAIGNFKDEKSGMFFYTADSHKDIVAKNMELDDNVLPSSNSVMAQNLYLLGTLLEEEEYLDHSDAMLNQMLALAVEEPFFYANWTKQLGLKAFGAFEIALVGDDAFEKNVKLQKDYLPSSVFMGGNTENLPLLKGKLIPGETLIYVCQMKTCKYPVSKVEEAIDILEEYRTGLQKFNQTWTGSESF